MSARALLVVVLAALGLPLVSAAAVKPHIGAPAATPKRATAGKPFSVAFRVSGAPQGTKARFAVTLGAAKLPHSDSFRGGVARTKLVVPASGGGKSLHVKVTVGSASRSASFAVATAAPPTVSIDGTSSPEGNSGTTAFAFPVTLSAAATHAVSVHYATADGSAKAPGDYAAASGTVTFAPGETSKTVTVNVVGDLAIEQDESFTVTLSGASGARLGQAQATGTITNDDTSFPVTPGNYQGATQEGNYVYFTVHPDRTITDFRLNSLSETCSPYGEIKGSISWGTAVFPIAADGSLNATGHWSGSEVSGNVEWTAENWSVVGLFNTATTINGTISLADDLKYNGNPISCSGKVTWSATLQG